MYGECTVLMNNILLEKELKQIFDIHKKTLKEKINQRKADIQSEENKHWEIYGLLGGFNKKEAFNVDFYQNVGRFFFKYCGSMLEEMTIKIIKSKKNAEKESVQFTRKLWYWCVMLVQEIDVVLR